MAAPISEDLYERDSFRGCYLPSRCSHMNKGIPLVRVEAVVSHLIISGPVKCLDMGCLSRAKRKVVSQRLGALRLCR